MGWMAVSASAFCCLLDWGMQDRKERREARHCRRLLGAGFSGLGLSARQALVSRVKHSSALSSGIRARSCIWPEHSLVPLLPGLPNNGTSMSCIKHQLQVVVLVRLWSRHQQQDRGQP